MWRCVCVCALCVQACVCLLTALLLPELVPRDVLQVARVALGAPRTHRGLHWETESFTLCDTHKRTRTMTGRKLVTDSERREFICLHWPRCRLGTKGAQRDGEQNCFCAPNKQLCCSVLLTLTRLRSVKRSLRLSFPKTGSQKNKL